MLELYKEGKKVLLKPSMIVYDNYTACGVGITSIKINQVDVEKYDGMQINNQITFNIKELKRTNGMKIYTFKNKSDFYKDMYYVLERIYNAVHSEYLNGNTL